MHPFHRLLLACAFVLVLSVIGNAVWPVAAAQVTRGLLVEMKDMGGRGQ